MSGRLGRRERTKVSRSRERLLKRSPEPSPRPQHTHTHTHPEHPPSVDPDGVRANGTCTRPNAFVAGRFPVRSPVGRSFTIVRASVPRAQRRRNLRPDGTSISAVTTDTAVHATVGNVADGTFGSNFFFRGVGNE